MSAGYSAKPLNKSQRMSSMTDFGEGQLYQMPIASRFQEFANNTFVARRTKK
jgi:hypothetical protein